MKRAPKVLFLDHSGAPGGAELYLRDVVAWREGVSHVMLFEDGAFVPMLRDAGLSVEVVPASTAVSGVRRESGILQALSALPGLFHLVRRVAHAARSFDVVFANSQKALMVGAVAAWWARRPFVWNLHDILTADHFSASQRRIVVWVANVFATRVVANSEASRKAFIAAGGLGRKTHVVYNGFDLDTAASLTGSEAERLRQDLGVPAEAPLVGLFSRLAPWKGQHILLDAVAALPNVHALLVGAPLFAGDEAYAGRLRDQAGRLGISDRVHFTGHREDVSSLIHLVDVVVHASVAPEPFGRVIVEGMLAGRPVIATRAGGAVEIVDDGRTGLLTPPGDAEALRQAIRMLLLNPEQAASMAQAGLEEAQARFSLETVAAALETHIAGAAQDGGFSAR